MRSYYYTLVAVLLTSVQQASGFAPGRHASLHRRATVGMAVKGREIEQLAKLIPDKASVQALFTSSDDGFLNRETFGNALVAEPPLSVEAIDQIWKMAGGAPIIRAPTKKDESVFELFKKNVFGQPNALPTDMWGNTAKNVENRSIEAADMLAKFAQWSKDGVLDKAAFTAAMKDQAMPSDIVIPGEQA
mmetsp:Transcript_60908/g.167232  ORF Transcript_60908/g.167232 Transcript_60908/m.167232 type:complete len:189 (-) Transcript_60908:279-845(-)